MSVSANHSANIIQEVIENDVTINIANTTLTPRKNEVLYNPDMAINR